MTTLTEAPLRSTVSSLEWVRRHLEAADHPAQGTLKQVLASLADHPNGAHALTHPWTLGWVDVAVRLLDRDALALLPDGQLAAHLGQATNLLAALRVGREAVTIRLDRHGLAWLPGTGAIVAGDPASAGLACTLVPLPDCCIDADALRWPALAEAVRVEGLAARLCKAPGDGPENGVAAAARHEVGLRPPALVSTASPTEAGERPPAALVALLEAHRIPVGSPPNVVGSDRIRGDASFDHLSLLSVRSPDDFLAVAQAAGVGSDRVSRRLQAHIAYIRRRHLQAAGLYADLLAEHPEDADLWRDVCWALRHAGHEELVRAWVLHPAETISGASRITWRGGATATGTDVPNLDRLIGYLEGETNDLRSR